MTRKSFYPLLLVALICITICSNFSYAFDYIFGTNKYPKPIIPKPSKGQTISDPNFQTSITRITDKTIDGYIDGGITNQYSQINPKNADGSYLLLRGTGAFWYLYDLKTFQLIPQPTGLKQLFGIAGYGSSGQDEYSPYWDASDPNILYHQDGIYNQYGNGPKFYKYDVRTKKDTLVHDFAPDFPQFAWTKQAYGKWTGPYIFKEDYNEPDRNARYWPFWIKEHLGGGTQKIRGAFIYDKELNKVIGTLYPPAVTGAGKGLFTVSPSGKYVLVARKDESGHTNVAVYDITLTQKKPFYLEIPGHCDLALDSKGNDVVVFQDTQGDYYAMLDIETGVMVAILKACGTGAPGKNYCPGIHMSGNNYKKPGWALISTYDPNGQWSDDQLFMLELNPDKGVWKTKPGNPNVRIPLTGQKPRVWRLAHTRSVGPAYWAQAFATIDQDGQYVYWGSNWDDAKTVLETYMLSLPASWYADLSGNTPPQGGITPPKPSAGLKIIK